MVFEPTGEALQSLLRNGDVLQLPFEIDIERRRPLTTRMWEVLFKEMNEAALIADLAIYDSLSAADLSAGGFRGRDLLMKQTDRFVVTGVNRGSIEIVGGLLLAAGWAYKNFVEPGWLKSDSKKQWDETVGNMIDKAVPILKDQIDFRIVHRLKRFKIKRALLRRPSEDGRRLSENNTLDVELIYKKTKQIEPPK